MAGLRAAHKAMTRKLLLDSALGLFRTKGYAATTIDEIAEAAGTTRATFYAYFPSRADLMKALIEELNTLLERTYSPAHGSTAPALVAAVRAGTRDEIREWLRARAAHWDVIMPYVLVAFEAAAVDPELRSLADQWLDEPAADIAEGLDSAGRFDPAGRRLRGVLAMAQLDYVSKYWTDGRWGVDLETLVDLLAESWHNILGAPGPDASPA